MRKYGTTVGMISPLMRSVRSAKNCFVCFVRSRIARNDATDSDQGFKSNLCLNTLPTGVVFTHPFRLHIFVS